MMENRSFDHLLGGLSLVMENGANRCPKFIRASAGDSYSRTLYTASYYAQG